MEFKVEDVSPVKKKVVVSVEPDEVNSAIQGSIALCKDSVQVDGYRKGKAPAGIVEKKFHDHIYNEARENLINVHINEILGKLDDKPLSGIHMTGAEKPLEKGAGYEYSMEFEILPKFDIPEYEGLSVEEEKTEISEKNIDEILQKMRHEAAKLVPVEGSAPPKDGQIVNIDFEAFENGKPLKDFKVNNYEMELGINEALPDFEKLVKSIPSGHTSEGIIHFPDDFLNEELAGKDVTMKVTIHSVKERELPELNDEFAKKFGHDNIEKLREAVTKGYLETVGEINKGAAQRRLLNQLTENLDIPLPQSLVDVETRVLLTDFANHLESQGRGLHSLGGSLDKVIEDMKPQAEKLAKSQVLLLSVAKKENLDVSDEEAAKDILKQCLKRGEDFRETMDSLQKSGMIYHLKDRMIADKAMDLIYSRANVTMVEPGSINGNNEEVEAVIEEDALGHGLVEESDKK